MSKHQIKRYVRKAGELRASARRLSERGNKAGAEELRTRARAHTTMAHRIKMNRQ